MTLQGNLQIEFENRSYELSVKSILLKGVYYFFINDHEKEGALLSGETLELVYTDGFVPAERVAGVDAKKIPEEKISAIKNMLLENKQLWYY